MVSSWFILECLLKTGVTFSNNKIIIKFDFNWKNKLYTVKTSIILATRNW